MDICSIFVWIVFCFFLDCFSICLDWFFDFFDFFGFFSISIGFQCVFFLNLIFFDFLYMFSIFWIFTISIGFQFDFFGFQSDFFLSVGEATSLRKKIEKNRKPNPNLFSIFLILIGSIPKSNRIEIQKNQNKIKKMRKIKKIVFFLTLKITDNHLFSWVNHIFLWPFPMIFCMFTIDL